MKSKEKFVQIVYPALSEIMLKINKSVNPILSWFASKMHR
jgi:hypothetical protein